MNIALNPATNPGSRSATIAAPSTPINATAFGPIPPRPSSTNSTAPRQTRSASRISGRVAAVVSCAPGASGRTKGQTNASSAEEVDPDQDRGARACAAGRRPRLERETGGARTAAGSSAASLIAAPPRPARA